MLFHSFKSFELSIVIVKSSPNNITEVINAQKVNFINVSISFAKSNVGGCLLYFMNLKLGLNLRANR